jgi:hypothetical protein
MTPNCTNDVAAQRLYSDELFIFRNGCESDASAAAVRRKLIKIAVEDDYIWRCLQTELRSSSYVTNEAVFAAVRDKDFLERVVVGHLERSGQIHTRRAESKCAIFVMMSKDLSSLRTYAAIPQGAAGHIKKMMTNTLAVCSKKFGDAAAAGGKDSNASATAAASSTRSIDVFSSGDTIKPGKVNKCEILEEFPSHRRRGSGKMLSARPRRSSTCRARAA